MTRTCRNCQSAEWPRYRYCHDCWRMVAKTLAAIAAGTVGAALGLRLAQWLF